MSDPFSVSVDKPAPRPVHPAALPYDALRAACTVQHTRASGPGGQHRNNNQTAVVLTHPPTGLTAQASERRSVEENKRVALRRLRLELALHHRLAVPPGEVRSDLWKSRTGDRRIVLSPQHDDYPAMLAEAMDILAACAFNPRKAAARLGVSPSQLVRMIAHHPPALVMVNRERTQRGEHELHA